jgi:hypothetical protein
MAKHGKKYLDARARIDREHEYPPPTRCASSRSSKSRSSTSPSRLHIRTG